VEPQRRETKTFDDFGCNIRSGPLDQTQMRGESTKEEIISQLLDMSIGEQELLIRFLEPYVLSKEEWISAIDPIMEHEL
jgi:hypothetical protein